MEHKNWNYEIWSYYFRENRKRDQIRNVLEKTMQNLVIFKGNLNKSLQTLWTRAWDF